MELELEAEDVAQGLLLTHVRLDQRDEELVLVRTALVHFQNDVQHAIRVQVETSCTGEKKIKYNMGNHYEMLRLMDWHRLVICAKHSFNKFLPMNEEHGSSSGLKFSQVTNYS